MPLLFSGAIEAREGLRSIFKSKVGKSKLEEEIPHLWLGWVYEEGVGGRNVLREIERERER